MTCSTVAIVRPSNSSTVAPPTFTVILKRLAGSLVASAMSIDTPSRDAATLSVGWAARSLITRPTSPAQPPESAKKGSAVAVVGTGAVAETTLTRM